MYLFIIFVCLHFKNILERFGNNINRPDLPDNRVDELYYDKVGLIWLPGVDVINPFWP
jgi:hypothetical protein